MALKRLDIQVLRGYAVLMVLLYHAGLDWAPAGYLGVDVFFVISGFLITGIIDRQLVEDKFSLGSFYLRRMQRLLPAAYVTFCLTSLASLWLLTSSELFDYSRQLTGAVTFTANYALKNQTGYFDGTADLKPLLHTWTLSVEEQFYLFAPLLLRWVSRRWHGALFLLLTLTSLAGNVYAHASPETMFYTLPYRAWELSLGALAARIIQFRAVVSLIRRVKAHWIAWAVVWMIPFVRGLEDEHLGITLLVCSSTAIILLSQSFYRQGGFFIQGMKWTGDISYSLYLVHWPLYALLNNMTVLPDQWTDLHRIGLIFISFLLAATLHYTVEAPILSGSYPPKSIIGMSTGLALLFTASSQWILKPSALSTGYLEIRKEDQGLGIQCTNREPYDPGLCRSGDSPRMLVWGDSMAMQLVNGLMSSSQKPISLQQATRSTCAPTLSMTYKSTPGGARNCIEFNRTVMGDLQETESVDIVVLAARWNHYLRPNVELLVFDGDGTSEILADRAAESLESSLSETIHTIRASGKRVVLIDAPPSAHYDVSRCIERARRLLPTLGSFTDCSIPNDEYRQLRLGSNQVMDGIAQRLKVSIIHFDEYLCAVGKCITQRDGTMLYRDNIHFSREGALKILREMALVTRIDQLAR